MADPTQDILIPKQLILPIVNPAQSLSGANIGTLVMSGAKMYVATSSGTFELVTSA